MKQNKILSLKEIKKKLINAYHLPENVISITTIWYLLKKFLNYSYKKIWFLK